MEDFYTDFKVDISINQPNGLRSSKITRSYLERFPGAKELCLVLKFYLEQNSINEVYNGGLGSYSLLIMVVSFLQVL